MTETIDTPYGFDDIKIGDRIRVTNSIGQQVVGDCTKIIDGHSAEIEYFGRVIDVYREGKIELISRPDPIADVVKAWVIEGKQSRVSRDARARLVQTWPDLADALDRLAESRA